MANRRAAALVLGDGDRDRLEALSRSTASSAGVVERARIVLAAAEGVGNERIAQRLGTSVVRVRKWRKRYLSAGVEGLVDAPRSGRPKKVDDVKVVALSLSCPPKSSGLETWSTREVAKRLGIGYKTVARIWKQWQIYPWREEGFRFSTDPEFEAKAIDVVGLYLDPPENSIVLCVDEKSQIQALDRAAPILPMQPGLIKRCSSDYVRHGTITLFAALEVATGKVTGRFEQRHRHQEFLAFLRQVARAYPGKELHIVCDNYAAHKHADVKAWLDANPRVQMHFTPTHASWMNLVEVFFSIAERKAIRMGTFRSVAQLIARIKAFIKAHNANAKPFVWTKSADQILEHHRKQKSTNDTQH